MRKLEALGYAMPYDIWRKPKLRPMPIVPADRKVSTFSRAVFWRTETKACEFRVGCVAPFVVSL